MKTIYCAVIAMFCLSASALAQAKFDPNIEVDFLAQEVVLPENPLQTQVLFVGGFHEVQTLDDQGRPNGTTLAKQWHDFLGVTPDTDNPGEFWVSCNHEMIAANDKIGDGGGMTVYKVRRDPATDSLRVIPQTLEDGRQGLYFNVDFANTVGETGMNCGGITSNADGRIWTAEEWFRTSNASIYDDGDGVRDTSDWTINTDIPGDFNGKTIRRYENFNWMVEIDPRQAKAIRKQYNWGRQGFEGGVVLPDNKTVYLGVDATPSYWVKFVAEEAGDFTRGKLYLYKQTAGAFTGSWVEINNSLLDVMLNIPDQGVANGCAMFNRLEWVAYNETDGKIYITETGRDNPGGRWADEAEAGAAFAQHHLDRAAEQGAEVAGGDYWDYYGRILVFDPADNSMRSFLEGGPFFAGLDAEEPKHEAYPRTHLSNPDAVNFMYVNGNTFMIIGEDLNGTSYGRVELGVGVRTCEIFLLDMSEQPSRDNLIRIGIAAMGAEATGVCPTPDGKTLLFNSQHPWPTNKFPYNNSCTVAITGFDKVITSIKERDDPNDEVHGVSFEVYPNPVSRLVRFNQPVDAALYDASGKRLRVVRNATGMDLGDLSAGIYFIQNDNGDTKKLIVE